MATCTITESLPSTLGVEKNCSHSPRKDVGIQELRNAIPSYCLKPSLFWSFFYLLRDLTYSAILLLALSWALSLSVVQGSNTYYYTVVNVYGVLQGIVWTGVWIIAHDAGHSAFSRFSLLNDTVGFLLHSALLAPYFPWKASHRRHHIYANHIEKDSIYVPPQRHEYARRIAVAIEALDEVGEDAPLVQFFRIVLQQAIGWNWYILSNITCPNTAVVNKNMAFWRYSHFDPWGGLFHKSETFGVILSDLGCLTTITSLYFLGKYLGDFWLIFWAYVVPWCWVNHWITMITFLQHTHPSIPKYTSENWTFLRGALATMDRDFGIIGTHFFHNITSDHVAHHLFPSIPHYYSTAATKAIVPVLGKSYPGRGTFQYADLATSFGCQWVGGDAEKDRAAEKDQAVINGGGKRMQALWFRKGPSPPPEVFQRGTRLASRLGGSPTK